MQLSTRSVTSSLVQSHYSSLNTAWFNQDVHSYIRYMSLRKRTDAAEMNRNAFHALMTPHAH